MNFQHIAPPARSVLRAPERSRSTGNFRFAPVQRKSIRPLRSRSVQAWKRSRWKSAAPGGDDRWNRRASHLGTGRVVGHCRERVCYRTFRGKVEDERIGATSAVAFQGGLAQGRSLCFQFPRDADIIAQCVLDTGGYPFDHLGGGATGNSPPLFNTSLVFSPAHCRRKETQRRPRSPTSLHNEPHGFTAAVLLHSNEVQPSGQFANG